MNEQALVVREALQSGAGAAEKQLAVIGTTGGDQQIAIVVSALTGAEIATLVADADMTKPSLAHTFVSPEQFMEAFGRIGARWGRIDKNSGFDWRAMQRDLADFICPMVLASSEARRRQAMLDALLKHSLGKSVLVALAIGDKDMVDFLQAPHDAFASHGSWQEILAFMANLHEYQRQFGLIKAKLESLCPEGEVSDKAVSFLRSTFNVLNSEARGNQPESTTAKGGNVFVDI